MALFNIATLAIRDSGFLHLKNPATDELLYTDKKEPVGIDLFSTSSKEYRSAVTAMQNRSLKRGKKQVSAEQMKVEGIDLLVSCSIKAKGFDYQGAPVDTPEAFTALYEDASLSWIKDQVDSFLGDVSGFLGV